MGRYYLMRCIFLVDRNKPHTATITCNTRMETGRKSDSRSVQIVRFVRTAVRRFPLMRCIFRVDRSCIRVVSLSEYWTCMEPGKSETDMTRHDKKKKTSKQENGQAKKQIMLFQSENPGLLIHFYNCSFPLKDSFALSTTLVCTNSTTRIMKRN